MARTTPKHKQIRNGLKWRPDAQGRGRPRWEPSPASRAAGVHGRDLKDLAGSWLAERGLAISVCDGRALWAQFVREAREAGPVGDQARGKLRAALAALPEPCSDEARLKRHLNSDLLLLARATVDGHDAAAGLDLARSPRSIEALLEAYFAAADASDDERVKISASTRRCYKAGTGRLAAHFPGRAVAGVARMELWAWYHGQPGKPGLKHTASSLAVANQAVGAAAAVFEFASKLGWIGVSPATRLGVAKPAGRLVFITLAEEQAFVPWCDANGYADVGDGFAAGLWTGARISDLCAAELEDLERPVWTYTPIKTRRKGQIAKPGILPQVRARLERRRAAAEASGLRHLAATPFLWSDRLGRRHNGASFWSRYTEARAAALAAQAAPDTLAGKKQQDTRDTCVTRLWLAGVDLARIWSWTGHSKDSCERILKDHYLSLLDEGSIDMARQLEAWAEREALKLG